MMDIINKGANSFWDGVAWDDDENYATAEEL